MKPAKAKPKRATSRPRQSNRFTIAIIGAGRLGTALGLALKKSGHSIKIVISRSVSSAKRAARLLETRGASVGAKGLAQLSSADRELLQHCSVLIICTPDDAIPQVAGELGALMSSPGQVQTVRSNRHRVTLHTSGALTSKVLSPLRDRGSAVGSVHPLISISGDNSGSPSFSGIHFAVEGDRRAVRLGKQLVRDLDGDNFVIDTDAKPLYHAAALMASPNLTALADIAIEMLEHVGISSSRARRILLPLISSTVENLLHQDPRHGLTGTFKRGDIATARMHLAAIASERLTDAMRAYITLGKRSLKLSDVPRTKRLEMESLLDQALSELDGR
jgi:predicted short-subunit dehydrogenase-like oxidoreductase (DUF2520 family)